MTDRAENYRKAALLVHVGEELSCRAACISAHGPNWSGRQWADTVHPYAALFSPSESDCLDDHWLTKVEKQFSEGELKNWRVLALCFMAAMVEAGDA